MEHLSQLRNDIIDLKYKNPTKFFEVLPDYISVYLMQSAVALAKASKLNIGTESLSDVLLSYRTKIDKSVKAPVNFKKVIIGSSIYVVGNLLLKYIMTKGGKHGSNNNNSISRS